MMQCISSFKSRLDCAKQWKMLRLSTQKRLKSATTLKSCLARAGFSTTTIRFSTQRSSRKLKGMKIESMLAAIMKSLFLATSGPDLCQLLFWNLQTNSFGISSCLQYGKGKPNSRSKNLPDWKEQWKPGSTPKDICPFDVSLSSHELISTLFSRSHVKKTVVLWIFDEIVIFTNLGSLVLAIQLTTHMSSSVKSTVLV